MTMSHQLIVFPEPFLQPIILVLKHTHWNRKKKKNDGRKSERLFVCLSYPNNP